MHDMTFKNLTPHAIHIVDGPTIEASGTVARCRQSTVPVRDHGGVALVHTTYGEVDGLPGPETGVVYLVSALVRAAAPERDDLASPGDLVRDSEGKIVGCRNLIIN
jgi:hypothetical protein